MKRKLGINASKVKKFLIIYSALMIAIAIFSGSVFFKQRNVKAAGWTEVLAHGSCGGGTCSCNYHGGCEVFWFDCPGQKSGICTINEHFYGNVQPGWKASYEEILGGHDCSYVQIDVNLPGESHSLGYYGAVELSWDDYSVCVETPPTPPPPGPPEEEACPYDSTQIKVRQSVNDSWANTLQLNCGESFIVGSFHNQNLSSVASDTRIKITDPNSNTIKVSNSSLYQTAAVGTYTISALTLKPNSTKTYPEGECMATRKVVCTQDNENPGFRITKVATNDDGPYDIGDIVNFRVVIENTGDQALDRIAYRDVFDNTYLRYSHVLAVSPKYPGGFNMTPYLSVDVNGRITTLFNPDITAQLGDLAPGKVIYFDYTFIARSASNRACNDVFANVSGLGEKQARDCVGIILSTDL